MCGVYPILIISVSIYLDILLLVIDSQLLEYVKAPYKVLWVYNILLWLYEFIHCWIAASRFLSKRDYIPYGDNMDDKLQADQDNYRRYLTTNYTDDLLHEGSPIA